MMMSKHIWVSSYFFAPLEEEATSLGFSPQEYIVRAALDHFLKNPRTSDALRAGCMTQLAYFAQVSRPRVIHLLRRRLATSSYSFCKTYRPRPESMVPIQELELVTCLKCKEAARIEGESS